MSKILNRRVVLGGLALGLVMPGLARGAQAAGLDAVADFGLAPNGSGDQSEKMQAALNAAAVDGRPLYLPAGGFDVQNLQFPNGLHLVGAPGQTLLTTQGDQRLAHIKDASGIIVEGVVFQANKPDSAAGVNGLVEIEGSTNVTFRQCGFYNSPANGIATTTSAVTIEDCDFEGFAAAAIHTQNGAGLMIRGNRIRNCDNAGIRVWRDDAGHDGTIITGNRIDKVDFKDGGNGQNGNGISIYKADDVVVSDNVISNCAFSAVRTNTGKNTQIRGNTCLASGEVAIFSEFGFSGSVIADNVVDGAATGISITNLDSGGHLATCTGNVVRNIAPKSLTNPDTRPVGIYAEADAVVSGNTVDNVPGVGIAAGYGPFVRNVVVADNVVTGTIIGVAVSVVQEKAPGPVRVSGNTVDNVPGVGIAAGYGSFVRNVVVADNVVTGTQIGVAVSVVQEKSPGPVRVSGNIIGAGTQHPIAGLEWEKIVSEDLAKDAKKYPNVTVSDNSVG